MATDRLRTQPDERLADAVDDLAGEDGEYDARTEAVTDLAKTGLQHREYQNDLVLDWLLYVAVASGILTMLLFGVAYADVLPMPSIVPMAAAGVALLTNTAYAVQLRTVMKVLNGGQP